MKRKNLPLYFDEISKERGIERELVKNAFEQALISGCKKEAGVRSCRVEINEEKCTIKIFKQRIVVGDYQIQKDLTQQPLQKMTQILLSDAKKIKPRGTKIGDILEEEVDLTNFSHSSARIVKNNFRDNLNKLVKERLYNYFKNKEGDVIKARIISIENGQCILDIGNDISTVLPEKEILPGERLHAGLNIPVIITGVDKEKEKHLSVYVSKIKPELVAAILKENIPEIQEGIVEVKAVVRDPGDRSKVGVLSYDPNVDPIGACIGEGKMRINSIQGLLRGEKIDLFKWSDDPASLIRNSLQPSDVVKILDINPTEKKALAIVPDDQLSLAIGNKGQNVQLAVRATGWKINIKSVQEAKGEGIDITPDNEE